MAQVCIETLHQDVCLPVSQMGSPVHRTAVTVGAFFTQVIGEFDLDSLAAYCRHVQVLIVCLRSAETGRVSQACLKIICRLVEQVDAGAENKLVYQVVLVQAGADQHGQYVHLPLILHEGAGNADILLHVTMIAGHDVVQGVVLIFQSAGEGGGGKEAVVHIAHIHAAGNPGQVFRLAVSIHVLLGTIVAVAVGVLYGGVSRNLMLVLLPEQIVAHASAIDDMLGLLGDVRLVRLQIEFVASATKFVGGMVFQIDAAEMRRTVIGAEAESIHVQLAQLGKAIAIAVVGVAVAVTLIKGNAVRVIFGNQRHIATHILLPGLAVHIGEHARYLKGIVDGVFGYNIDSSSHSIGAKQGRASATHHFYPFNHVHGDLLQSVHTAQCTDDGTAVYQYLRIRTFQAIDAHLGEAAVLAVVLHAQARLVVQCLGKVGGVDHLEQFGTHHIYNYRSCLAAYLVAVGGYHHFIGHETLLFHREMYDGSKVLAHRHLLLLGLVTHCRHTELVFSRRKLAELKLSFFIGNRSLTTADNQNRGIRYIFLRTFHYHMAGNHIAFFYRIYGKSYAGTYHCKYQRQNVLFHQISALNKKNNSSLKKDNHPRCRTSFTEMPDFETKMPGIYIQKIQAFLNLMTMKKEREEREGKGYVSLPP